MPDIVMQDLYGVEQVYENVTEFALKRTDGVTEWFIERPRDYFVLRDTDYEPPEAVVVATGGVGPMFGDGELNLLMVGYSPMEGVTEHAVISLACTLNNVRTGYYYVYESLTGDALLTAISSDGNYAGTAQPGWNILENVDGVDTLRHIDDPESESIVIPHPYTIIDDAAFYSFLSPAGQENKSVTLTENGTVSIEPEPGSRGLRSVQVTVDVSGGTAKLQKKSVTLTDNGTTTVTPDEGYDGLSGVTVNVAVEGGASGTGGVRRLAFLPRTTFTSALDAMYGYTYHPEGIVAEFFVGDTYTVIWGEEEYTCVAQDAGALIPGAVFIGNAAPFGLSGNNEPFAIGTVGGGLLIACLTDTAPAVHTAAVYQQVETDGTWKHWQLVNGQCAVTEEEYKTYFSSSIGVAALGLLDAAPLGVEQKVMNQRSVCMKRDNKLIMWFVQPASGVNSDTGELNSFSAYGYIAVCIEPAEGGGYTMRALRVQMGPADVTAMIAASEVPQTIYAVLLPVT